jgi:hypothetical protein
MSFLTSSEGDRGRWSAKDDAGVSDELARGQQTIASLVRFMIQSDLYQAEMEMLNSCLQMQWQADRPAARRTVADSERTLKIVESYRDQPVALARARLAINRAFVISPRAKDLAFNRIADSRLKPRLVVGPYFFFDTDVNAAASLLVFSAIPLPAHVRDTRGMRQYIVDWLVQADERAQAAAEEALSLAAISWRSIIALTEWQQMARSNLPRRLAKRLVTTLLRSLRSPAGISAESVQEMSRQIHVLHEACNRVRSSVQQFSELGDGVAPSAAGGNSPGAFYFRTGQFMKKVARKVRNVPVAD